MNPERKAEYAILLAKQKEDMDQARLQGGLAPHRLDKQQRLDRIAFSKCTPRKLWPVSIPDAHRK